MITFIACPREFVSPYAVVQRNAILSWKRLSSCKNIVLCGNDGGIKEFCEEHDLIHEPDIKISDSSVPILPSALHHGYKHADKMVCYINSDILLTSDFDKTVKSLMEKFSEEEKMMVVGRRKDIDFDSEIIFNDDWERKFLDEVDEKSKKFNETCVIDYFLHTKSTYDGVDIPEFRIGRFCWDGWLVHNVISRGLFSVDITNTAPVLHLNSPYKESGKVVDWQALQRCQDGKFNKSAARGCKYVFTTNALFESHLEGGVCFSKR